MIAFGFSLPSFLIMDGRFEAGDVDIVGHRIDVDEDGFRLGQRHHFGGGGEGEARHEHSIPWSDAGGKQRQQQRIGAVGAGHDMLGADIGGELLLELRHLRAQDVATVFDDMVDRGLQPVADTFALRAKIDELHVGLKTVMRAVRETTIRAETTT